MELDRCARELAKESQRRAAVNSDTAEVHHEPAHTIQEASPQTIREASSNSMQEASSHTMMHFASPHTIVKAGPHTIVAFWDGQGVSAPRRRQLRYRRGRPP